MPQKHPLQDTYGLSRAILSQKHREVNPLTSLQDLLELMSSGQIAAPAATSAVPGAGGMRAENAAPGVNVRDAEPMRQRMEAEQNAILQRHLQSIEEPEKPQPLPRPDWQDAYGVEMPPQGDAPPFAHSLGDLIPGAPELPQSFLDNVELAKHNYRVRNFETPTEANPQKDVTDAYPASPIPGQANGDTRGAPDPVQQVQAPAPAQEKTIADVIADHRKIVDSIYPKLDTSLTEDEKGADAYADRERQRAKLLAQLAFASGITASAGGTWKDVAKGMLAAGGAYDEGFQRYQEALNKRGERSVSRKEAAHADDTARTDAAVKLWQDEMKSRKEAFENERKFRADFYKTGIGALSKNDDGLGGDDAELKRLIREYQRDAGVPIDVTGE